MISRRKRVLVFAYYFPPMALSGVQRVAKFVKYLPQFGWEPHVVTVEPGGYFAYDESLLEEVIDAGVQIYRTPSFDPTRFFRSGATVSLPAESKRKWLSTISQAMFVPDNKIGWRRLAVKKGAELIASIRPDAIFSSAPPYTAHLIATELGQRYDLPVLIDFRDDWVGNPRHTYVTPIHRALHRRLENRVVRSADRITTINTHITRSLESNHKDLNLGRKIHVLPQGYDPEDYSSPMEVPRGTALSFLYSGVFYDVQTPDSFLKSIRRLLDVHRDMAGKIAIDFVGLFPDSSRKLIKDLKLEDQVTIFGYMSHREAVHKLQQATVLWMMVGNRPGSEGISTGKLYEYMGSRKPILALAPDGVVRETLSPYGPSYLTDPDNHDEITATLERMVTAWKTGAFPAVNESYVAGFDRKALAHKLAILLDEMIETDPDAEAYRERGPLRTK